MSTSAASPSSAGRGQDGRAGCPARRTPRARLRAGAFPGGEPSPGAAQQVSGGAGNPGLCQRSSEVLDAPPTDPRLRRWPDGEISVKTEDAMRGHDVFVIQPTSPPVNEHLMELF